MEWRKTFLTIKLELQPSMIFIKSGWGLAHQFHRQPPRRIHSTVSNFLTVLLNQLFDHGLDGSKYHLWEGSPFVMRAISRQIGSTDKVDVSSIITSTPVKLSKVRMLRPSTNNPTLHTIVTAEMNGWVCYFRCKSPAIRCIACTKNVFAILSERSFTSIQHHESVRQFLWKLLFRPDSK